MRPCAAAAGVGLCVAVLVCCWAGTEGDESVKLLSPASDPLARIDRYTELISADVSGRWSRDQRISVGKMAEILGSLPLRSMVEVRLVGFSGDGNFEIDIPESEMVSLLQTLSVDDGQLRLIKGSLESAHRSSANSGEPNGWRVNVTQKLYYRVTHAPRTVAKQINTTLYDRVIRKQENNVPVASVDEILRVDFTEAPTSFAMYLLNPPSQIINQGDEGVELVSYWYKGHSKSVSSSCGLTHWPAADERYAWVDTSSGPVPFGPHTSGDGLVSEFTLPSLEHFKNGPSSTLDVEDFLADCAALVRRSVDSLVAPHLSRPPHAYTKKITVKVIVITTEEDSMKAEDLVSEKHLRFPDVLALEQALERLAVGEQKISVFATVLHMKECQACMAIWHNSIRGHTSTVVRGALRTIVHRYVDSEELHEAIKSQEAALMEAAGGESLLRAKRGDDMDDLDDMEDRVIPAFVFDVAASDVVLLDRRHQAVAFDDMVVAVQTPGIGSTSVDFSCNGESVTVPGDDCTRPLLAALLDVGWSVAGPHLSWNDHKGNIDVDWLWAVGNTPFGPFSTSSKLSQYAVDVAQRNAVLGSAWKSVSFLQSALQQVAESNISVVDALPAGLHEQWVRRWNLLAYKWERCASYLSLHNAKASLYYALSARFDAMALLTLLGSAATHSPSHYICESGSQSTSRPVAWLVAAVAMVWVAWDALKRRIGRSRKTFKAD